MATAAELLALLKLQGQISPADVMAVVDVLPFQDKGSVRLLQEIAHDHNRHGETSPLDVRFANFALSVLATGEMGDDFRKIQAQMGRNSLEALNILGQPRR